MTKRETPVRTPAHVKPASGATAADRVNAAATALATSAMIGYWVNFFTTGTVRTSEDPCWEDFERAFPLADAYLAVTTLAAARQMWRGRASAVGLGIAGGSAAVYVGLMDILYNIQHGKYADRTPQMVFEVFFNIAAPTLGVISMVRMWRGRHRLGA